MKIALLGQDMPMLLPALLADLLFACGETGAEVTLEEKNPAMADVLQGYGGAVFRHAGLPSALTVTASREEALRGANAVLYAGDPRAASGFDMDRNALGSDDEDNPGLTDQARVNGGLEGLLHALRAGDAVLDLCDDLDRLCPETVIINLGQPMARTTGVFLNRGYRCFGLGRSPLRGSHGVDTYARRLGLAPAALKNLTSPSAASGPETAEAVTGGLPGFAFLLSLREGKRDLMPKLRRAAENGEMGSLAKRWLSWWDALPVGDVTDLAEFLPAQEGFIPEEHPEFGETVEKRKERILYMNTVREQGADSREGAMAQLLLLSKAPPVRPVRLALALLRRETAVIPAVTRRNGRLFPQLPPEAVVEAPLYLAEGRDVTPTLRVSEALADILTEVDRANRLAAKAAEGDREAVREYIETDPALAGLDRLYCLDVADALIRLHAETLSRF